MSFVGRLLLRDTNQKERSEAEILGYVNNLYDDDV